MDFAKYGVLLRFRLRTLWVTGFVYVFGCLFAFCLWFVVLHLFFFFYDHVHCMFSVLVRLVGVHVR